MFLVSENSIIIYSKNSLRILNSNLTFLGHHNPHQDQWPANSSLTVNPRVKIGNFLLGTGLKEKFEDFKPFTSDERPRLEGVKIYAGQLI